MMWIAAGCILLGFMWFFFVSLEEIPVHLPGYILLMMAFYILAIK